MCAFRRLRVGSSRQASFDLRQELRRAYVC
jgi:hypothetical protein